jgi:hypothetical protein
MLLAVQNSQFALWLSQDIYPIILTLHSVGLAVLVGLLIITDLRVLGFGVGLPYRSLRGLMKVVWIGFWVNVVSGTLLFCISPDKLFHSNLFRIKLSFIALGLILGVRLNSSLERLGADSDPRTSSSTAQRTMATFSLVCWASAIATGRWLAYTTFADIGITDVVPSP